MRRTTCSKHCTCWWATLLASKSRPACSLQQLSTHTADTAPQCFAAVHSALKLAAHMLNCNIVSPDHLCCAAGSVGSSGAALPLQAAPITEHMQQACAYTHTFIPTHTKAGTAGSGLECRTLPHLPAAAAPAALRLGRPAPCGARTPAAQPPQQPPGYPRPSARSCRLAPGRAAPGDTCGITNKNVLQAAMTRCKSVMHYVQEKRLATLSRATAASLFVAMMVSINEVVDGD